MAHAARVAVLAGGAAAGRGRGKAYEDALPAYLNGKYSAQPPSLVIAGGDRALGYLLEHRQQMFANAPLLRASGRPPLRPPTPKSLLGEPQSRCQAASPHSHG